MTELTFYFITGYPRSGTSALTKAMHMAGCCMGTRMFMPAPGTDTFEWEDIGLLDALGIDGMRRYVENRIEHSYYMEYYNIGAKNNLVSSFSIDMLEQVLAEYDIPMVFINCLRSRENIHNSLSRLKDTYPMPMDVKENAYELLVNRLQVPIYTGTIPVDVYVDMDYYRKDLNEVATYILNGKRGYL